MHTTTSTRAPAPFQGAEPRRAGRHVALAREHTAGYTTTPGRDGRSPAADRDAGTGAADRDGGTGAADRDGGTGADGRDGGSEMGGVPFGLPVLAEVPELAQVLDAAHRADRLMLDVVLGLSDLLGSDRVAATTGVDVDHWLAATARMTRLDRNLLRRLCRLLVRFPALRAATVDRRVSFAQLRALTLALHRAPTVADGPLNVWLAAALEQLPTDADPDVLVRQAGTALDELLPELLEQQEVEVGYQRSLTIQPDLLGTGGTYHGTEDALGLAILEAATAPRHDQHDRNIARTRADNLQAHLRHTCTDHPTSDADPDGATGSSDGTTRETAAAAAAGVVGSSSPVTGGGPGELTAPRLLLRCELDSLLDATATPATILTRLAGGRLRLTSRTARRLIDQRGAQLRTIIVDDGAVVGVGRATRIPPGWLADATLAVHDTCTGPICDRPALGADLDHAHPWTPTHHQPGGPTDLDNIGPLCPATNRAKQAAGWRTHQTTRGTRTWHHPRTGLTITSVPTTWRPAGLDPPPHHHDPPRHRGRDGAHPPDTPAADHPAGDHPAGDPGDTPDGDDPF